MGAVTPSGGPVGRSGGVFIAMHMLLHDKVAVVYGASGAIGGAVTRAFEAEGATVFAPTHAEVDALDEPAIERHLDSVGRVDIAFDATGLPNDGMLGTPLLEIDAERFARPIADYTTSFFLTARARPAERRLPVVFLSARPRRGAAHDPPRVRRDHDRQRAPRPHRHAAQR